MSLVVRAPHIEPRSCPFTTKPRDQAGFPLFLGGINGPNLHSPAHDFQQPRFAVDSKVSERYVELFVPVNELTDLQLIVITCIQ